MKKTVLLAIILALGSIVNAADLFTEKLIEARTLLNDGYSEWDESKMQQGLSGFQRLLVLNNEPWLVHFYIAMAEYRISIYYMSQQDGKSQAGQYLAEAVEQLRLCQAENENFVESYALLSSCYGNLAGLSPLKGITLGPRAGAAIDKALKLDPDNPRVWFQKGLGSFYTPKIFGGGKDKALNELTHAIELYEKEDPLPPLHPQWGHDEAFAWLGQIYQEKGLLQDARKAYEAGLRVNPANGLIKYTLLPCLEKATEVK